MKFLYKGEIILIKQNDLDKAVELLTEDEKMVTVGFIIDNFIKSSNEYRLNWEFIGDYNEGNLCDQSLSHKYNISIDEISNKFESAKNYIMHSKMFLYKKLANLKPIEIKKIITDSNSEKLTELLDELKKELDGD